MRNIKKCAFVLVFIVGVIINFDTVDALDNEYGIYCEYGDYYFIYSGDNKNDVFNMDTNFDSLGIAIESGRPGKSFSDSSEQEWLKSKGIINSSGDFVCPKNAFGSQVGASTAKECGNENCNVVDVESKNDGNNSSTLFQGECPEILVPIFKFIKEILTPIIQIGVPILLIVMGSVDLGRAVISSDDKAIKEATSRLIRRCIAAIAVFFVITIVTALMNLFAKTDIGSQSDWQACWTYLD